MNTFISKLIGRLLAFTLCVSLVLCACPALAAQGDALILRSGVDGVDSVSIMSMAYVDDTLYIMDYEKFFTYDGALHAHELTLPTQRQNANADLLALITDDNKVRALVVEYLVHIDGETYMSAVAGLYLYTLTANPEEAVTLTDPVSLDFTRLVDGEEGYEYLREVSYPFIQDGKLVFVTYTEYGSAAMVYDLESGKLDEYIMEELSRLIKYKDGKVLTSLSSYDEYDYTSMYKLGTLDLETGDIEVLFNFGVPEYSQPMGIVYEAKTNNLYYLLTGELMRIQDMNPATAISVNSVQIDSWSNCPPILTEDGFYIATDYGTVVKRNTDPSARPERNLMIQQTYHDAVTNAYYAFEKFHGDVEIGFKDNVNDIIQAMMSHDDSMDIYYLPINSKEYAAMFSRGYLAELTSSAKLTALAEDMYPAIRSTIEKNGELYALPITIGVNSRMGMSIEAMQKLALSEDDLPRTWKELFEFFEAFPTLAQSNAGVTLFDNYYTRNDIKRSLFYNIISEYMLYMQKHESMEMSFDTKIFRELMEALENIDYEALGVPEEITDDMWRQMGEPRLMGVPSVGLMTTYADISAYVYSLEYTTPLLLSFLPDEKPLLHSDLYVMVINPFSKERALAIEFLETLADKLPAITRTQLSQTLNEPVKNEYYEESIKNQMEYVESLKEQLATVDEEFKPAYQELIDEQLKYIEEFMLKNEYDISLESIANYRKYAQFIAPEEFFGMDEEGSKEFSMLLDQYFDGAINVDTFIKSVDSKLRMMMLEGI